MLSRPSIAVLLLLAVVQLAGGVGVLCDDGDDHAAWALAPCGCSGVDEAPATGDGSCDSCDTCEDVQAVVLAPGDPQDDPTRLWRPAALQQVAWVELPPVAVVRPRRGECRRRRPAGPERLIGNVVLTC